MHPCGLSVNISAFRSQPHSFWREALKQLMHSLSMGMVRDKAVGTFIERINIRPLCHSLCVQKCDETGKSPQCATNFRNSSEEKTEEFMAGWLELRKGVGVFLEYNGTLIIFKPDVFFTQMQGNGEVGLVKDLEEGEIGVKQTVAEETQKNTETSSNASTPTLRFCMPLLAENKRLVLGAWEIRLRLDIDPDSDIFQNYDFSPQHKALPSVHALLAGNFSYALQVYTECQELEFLCAREAGRKAIAPPPPALTGLDTRLRGGLPLLAPRSLDRRRNDDLLGDDEPRLLLLNYRFVFEDK